MTFKRVLGWVALVWAVRAIVVWSCSYAGSFRLGASGHPITSQTPHPYFWTPERWLDCFFRWDVTFYREIAEVGYSAASLQLAAFFPGFPLLLRGLQALHIDHVRGGIVANFALLFVGLLIIAAYARRELPVTWEKGEGRLHELGVRLTLRSPLFFLLTIVCFHSGTYYFTSLYSESAFLVCVATALWCVSDGRDRSDPTLPRWLRWALLSAACAWAGILRPQGLAVSMLVVCAAFLEKRSARDRVLLLSASTFGLMTFGWHLSVLQNIYGDPFAFFRAQHLPMWNRHVSVFGAFRALFANFHFDPDHFVAAYWALCAVALRVVRRAPWPESLMLFAMALLPLSTGTVWSFPRFYLTMIPAHVELAHPRTPWLLRFVYFSIMIYYALYQSYRVGAGFAFQ